VVLLLGESHPRTLSEMGKHQFLIRETHLFPYFLDTLVWLGTKFTRRKLLEKARFQHKINYGLLIQNEDGNDAGSDKAIIVVRWLGLAKHGATIL
jgi:hypothetical protein